MFMFMLLHVAVEQSAKCVCLTRLLTVVFFIGTVRHLDC